MAVHLPLRAPAARDRPARGRRGRPGVRRERLGGAGPALSRSLSEGLYVPGETVVHRLPAHVKILTLLAFVVAVVATPREQVWAFAVHAAVLVGVVALARLRPGLVLRRMVIEIPFVLFALLLPFVAEGERVEASLAGLTVSLSVPGVLGGFNILAKGTLGVVGAIVLAATTQPRDLVVGLQRLRVPSLFVSILQFMIRYLDIVVDDMRRMRVARESRGFRARHAGHVPVLARSAGALFIRSYERGERVHRAMLSRGYAGVMPAPPSSPTGRQPWLAAAVVPGVAVVVAVSAVLAGDATAWRPGA